MVITQKVGGGGRSRKRSNEGKRKEKEKERKEKKEREGKGKRQDDREGQGSMGTIATKRFTCLGSRFVHCLQRQIFSLVIFFALSILQPGDKGEHVLQHV